MDNEPLSAGTKVGIAAALATAALFVGLLIAGALAPATTAARPHTKAPSSSAAAEHRGPTVKVDVQAGEYFFKSAMTTFKVGVHYRFVLHNVGAIAHEFMLVQPIMPGMMSMDDMDKMAIGHIEFSDMPAHGSATVDVTFTKPYRPGSLEMACHVGKHYEKGMHIPIVVTT